MNRSVEYLPYIEKLIEDDVLTQMIRKIFCKKIIILMDTEVDTTLPYSIVGIETLESCFTPKNVALMSNRLTINK